MRWCAALAVVLVALVVVTVRGLRRPERRQPTADPDSVELTPPAVVAPPSPAFATQRPSDRDAGGIAQLRGRVLFPAGEAPTDELVVVAEDPARTVNAQVKDGRFDVHLPPGRYTLIASFNALVGVVPDVVAHAGTAGDVDIRLATGATIGGRLRAAGEVTVRAVPTGRTDGADVADANDGHFSVLGLIPGRRYDVTFFGSQVRALTLTGVTAPTDDLDVELQPRAVVAGAIGFPRGSSCPISTVELQVGGNTLVDGRHDDASTSVGPDCRFSLAVPDQSAFVTVVASGEGWHLEEQVAIPASGDPTPICLNPPCRSNPTENVARLRLTLDGSPTEMNANVWAGEAVRRELRHRRCEGSDGRCEMDQLFAGATYSITARGPECRATGKVTLVAGDNDVHLTCHRHRQIEGVVRTVGTVGTEPGGGVTVRCSGSEGGTEVLGTHLFQLNCRADTGAIEYQIGTRGNWRRVPIASSDNPAFVDIGPL